MGATIRVAAVQMEPMLGQVSRNLGRIVAGLEHAASEGARLAVFPECALSGYGFESREDGYAHAVAVDGPEVAAIAKVAGKTGCGCVFGFLEKDGEKLYNACALVGPGGVVGTYRKIHLPYLGIDMHVDPGDRPLAVHEINGLRIGVQICYDGSFPEASRVLALLGADLIALPTNWPTSAECAAEHMIPTRAMENTVYVMAVNRVGVESGFRFIGASSIADPAGNVMARAGDCAETTLFADIDPEKSRTKRLVRVPGRHEINRIADRRPAFYGPLVEPNGR
ncbi:MAG: carbon-nitrogen hydrolase family protein [Paludisphaera borealis]|uniref:carbon-nitrogen hydrolase family protein n=1 Tax=Paludisphaera borealis TaxID=1387353 RepID=UPI00283D1F07|nr:carbon-nitrogen hydrolase family protein [Paludisphaera borealis]MDR3620569.1 carbon-nitrogen hydrolase family protein [Paludisphaera borealis]